MNLPAVKTAVPGPMSQALAAELHHVENPNITYLDSEGKFPIFWDSASGCLVTDVDGNTYLDLTAAFGVAAIGHTHPRVVAAIQRQAEKLIHGMGDVHPSAVKVQLAKKIAEHMPGNLSGVIFGQNGGDAIEAAIKSARLYTGKPGIVAFTTGYHGLTFGALALTGRPDFKTPFSGQIPPFAVHVPYAEPRYCPLSCDACNADCLRFVKDALEKGEVGAVIAEPIQGRGGIIVPPDGWLAELQRICHHYGSLLILDEIFTGWGRTGDWFACNRENVVPDILCIGKAMGGGFPISACVARPEVTAAWGKSSGEALHTSTFLGNPLGCAAALAAISVIVEEDLPNRARTFGDIFRQRLVDLSLDFPEHIAEVRGRGLMLGLRFHQSPFALALVSRLLQKGLIVLPAGPGDILEFVPPLIITVEQIDFAVAGIEAALREATPERNPIR